MGSARQERRKETRRAQRTARPTLSPRTLARSVGKAMSAGGEWRGEVAKLPRTGRKYLRPERHTKKEERA